MKERDVFQSSVSIKNLRVRKIFASLAIFLISSLAFAQGGYIHLLYANGVTYNVENTSYFEFDVQAYMTNAGDVIGDGMVYVEYPVDVFNETVVYNQKVSVIKTGILAKKDPIINGDLYKLVNITDTKMNMFAITFSSTYQTTDLKPYYSAISSDPSNPSDLLHITMEINNLAPSSVRFPSTVPDYQLLYYNYEGDCFTGVDISEAIEVIYEEPVIEDPIIEPGEDPIPDPIFTGQVELASFTANLKKSIVTLKWLTSSENNIAEYIVQRSENGVDYKEIAHVEATERTKKLNRYKATDKNTISGIKYSYRLDAVDTNGNIKTLSTTGIATNQSRKKVNYFLENDDFALGASYPNPFNPSFTVPFTISRAQEIDIKLYDMSGKIVANVASGYYTAGSYKINVDCNHLGSGVYLLRTIVNGKQSTQKMLLVK
ncbi:MAG: hypothetical protein DRP93_03750 [Candidatus Neomarinimicrobiota bacterium]|nr:MAG: hypothetical protein DRP93_03750 [Candidatus Neomarinimicrobiota bacterium]